MARLPAQLTANPGGIDRVAAVMAGPVGHRGDQACVGRPLRPQLIEKRANGLHHLLVRALSVAANAIALTRHTLGRRQQQGIHMVFHKQPVAHVGAIPVKRDRLSRKRLEDHNGDQLFRELPRAKIIAAVGQHHRQAIGVMPGHHQMVARSLGCRIRAARVVGGGF